MSALTAPQLRELYDLIFRLGPLRTPAAAAQEALAGCAALCGASAGALLAANAPPATLGLDGAAGAMLPGLPLADLARAAAEAGGALLLPAGLPPLPDGPALAVALASGDAAALLLLGGFGAAAPSPAILLAAAPLVAQALARSAHHALVHAAERARDQIVNLLVHDIRSPLVATHASIEVTLRLLSGRDIPSSVPDALQTGLRSVRTAVDLCNDMLEVKRLQAGHRIARHPVDLGELLDEVAQMLQGVASQRDSRLSFMVAPHGLTVPGDVRLLRRVLINLATNALRFTPGQGGLVEMSAAADSGAVLLAVSDNGPGVPPADRERIFEPFEQGSGEVGRGTGLGLYFCRQAVLSHDGAIWVEDRPGGGCRFIVRLPRQ